MLNVFRKSAEELHIQLSDGRKMPLEDLVRDYEKLLKQEDSKKATESKLEVGKWFRIDREVIKKNIWEIRCKCDEAGTEGKALWKRFKWSNEYADSSHPGLYPYQYSRLIETYIFKHSWEYKTSMEMLKMCRKIGDGMCDEIICNLELQMRLCNGESVDDLLKKPDELPRRRIIILADGNLGTFGGGSDDCYRISFPPAELSNANNGFSDSYLLYKDTPYAYRWVLS